LSRLRILLLWKARGGSGDLSWLRGKTRLEMLQLGFIPVRDDDLIHLKPLTDLTSLDFHSPYITDAGLVHLAGLTHLQYLGFRYASIRGEGLVHLGRMKSLQALAILRSRIETLDDLPALPIEYLILPFTAIDDRGLARCRTLPTLKKVILDGTNVTDAGLECLSNQPNIEVDVNGTGVTASGAAAFRAKQPQSKVIQGPIQSSPYFSIR
jgi:Leucine Rich Repeat (LRR) protein